MRISDWSSDVCSSDLVDVTPLANHVELHRLAQPPRRDAEFQGTRIVYLAAIDGQHDIARLEAGAIGRAAAIDGLDQHAAGAIEAEAAGEFEGHGLTLGDEPWALDALAGQSTGQRRGHEIGRDGKADADRD